MSIKTPDFQPGEIWKYNTFHKEYIILIIRGGESNSTLYTYLATGEQRHRYVTYEHNCLPTSMVIKWEKVGNLDPVCDYLAKNA